MRQMTIISGKGGTGKTTLAASFAALAEEKVVADCDVDAPDLHLLLHPKIIAKSEFYGLKVAKMDKSRCIECGRCEARCRFGAISDISSNSASSYEIDPTRCEGCGVCVFVCPQDAVALLDRISGYMFISETKYGSMVHAQLNVAEETSGKLVTFVRNTAQKIAEEEECKTILIDGSPGI
ncbi:MAG TPA: 4Fe-4S dicluster domain-containing protein, partial [Methanosarcinales archaeon]|nr:4Fe-4S dicluster domain-containing protein [Methanosarcinales archaeon]